MDIIPEQVTTGKTTLEGKHSLFVLKKSINSCISIAEIIVTVFLPWGPTGCMHKRNKIVRGIVINNGIKLISKSFLVIINCHYGTSA